MLTVNTENFHYYTMCRSSLVDLGLQPGQLYQTPVGDKLSVPLIDGSFGLDVLNDPAHPEITNTHRVLFRVAVGDGLVNARFFATADMQTNEYVRPGMVHRTQNGDLRQLVVPNRYDGYQVKFNESGEVEVAGLVGIEPEELPVFDHYPDSATALLMATYKSICGVVERVRSSNNV